MTVFENLPALPMVYKLACRQLTADDAGSIMTLQQQMLAALPDPSWYYPSDEAMFAGCCARGESFGFFDKDVLVAFGTLTPWYNRPEACYAIKVNHLPQNTYDFQDVMVAPAYRRQGLHKALLAYFVQLSRDVGGNAMYCTIAPDNQPSNASFQKAGFRHICTKPAYQGMLRGYFIKQLASCAV